MILVLIAATAILPWAIWFGVSGVVRGRIQVTSFQPLDGPTARLVGVLCLLIALLIVWLVLLPLGESLSP
jgi:hypothetical protein